MMIFIYSTARFYRVSITQKHKVKKMKKTIMKLIELNQEISSASKLKRLEKLKNKNNDIDVQYLQYASDNLQNCIDWLIKYQVKVDKLESAKKAK